MGKYPVTQVQWRVVANLPQVSRELAPDPSGFKGDKRPVESVSWYDAVEFCERLSAYTGREYRLPSEAEWEYACRASPMPTSATPASGEVRSANPIFRAGISKAGEAVGNNTPQPFHFGKTITTDVANYRGRDNEKYKWSGSYGEEPKGEYRQETTPVDHFKIANAFGLCDMHGNVWEWCADHWHDSYEGAQLAARQLFGNAAERPDAVFVGSDHMALAVMDVLRSELNLRIPEDVSVVGFDNVPQAAWGAYQLTTVEQPVVPMIEATAQMLHALLHEGAQACAVTVPCQLIVRTSSRTSSRAANQNPAS